MQVEHIIIGWLSVFVVRLAWQRHRTKIKRWLKRTQDGLPRRWRAKSPHDCPGCRSGVRFESPVIQWKVTPYAQCKSKRGRKNALHRRCVGYTVHPSVRVRQSDALALLPKLAGKDIVL